MKHIQVFEEFINESSNQKYDIARLVSGNIKELITGNLRELTYRFSKAIDDATKFNNKLSDDPKTVEEFLELINLAQKLKDKFKGNTEYKLWDKKKGEPIKESEDFLNEADSGAWKSFNTPANKNFIADVKQEISNWNWVANIAKEAEKSREILIKILFDLGYDNFDPADMGFEIRAINSNEGPFQYRGAIFCNVNAARKSSADYNRIQSNPEFKKYFESISPVTWVGQPTNAKYASMIVMNRTQLPR